MKVKRFCILAELSVDEIFALSSEYHGIGLALMKMIKVNIEME